MVLRRRRGDREIVEVWMDGRIECRVLRHGEAEESGRLQRWKCVQRWKCGWVGEWNVGY